MTKKWYENIDLIDKLKSEFEKVGLPLEYRARRIFEGYGFEAWSSHYKVPTDNILDTSIVEKEGTWRQFQNSRIKRITTMIELPIKLVNNYIMLLIMILFHQNMILKKKNRQKFSKLNYSKRRGDRLEKQNL